MKLFNSKKILCILCTALAISPLFAQGEKPDALKEYNNRNYTKAIQICENELIENNANMNSYTVLCWALIANGQYALAEQKAIQARKVNAYDIRIIEALAEAKYYLNKNDEALRMFQLFIANANDNASRLGKVYYLMGEIYIKQAKYEHADISLTTAVLKEPLSAYWWFRLGYAREHTADYSNAIRAYDKAVSLDGSLSDAKLGKERCLSHIHN